jgi:hypothetical protein
VEKEEREDERREVGFKICLMLVHGQDGRGRRSELWKEKSVWRDSSLRHLGWFVSFFPKKFVACEEGNIKPVSVV